MSQLTIDLLFEYSNKPTIFELRGLGIDKINSCPFCFYEEIHLIEDDVEVWVRCSKCGADGPPYLTRLGAINSWHYRPF